MTDIERKRIWRSKPENKEKERLRTQKRWRNDPRVKVRRMVQLAKHRGHIPDLPCVSCGAYENVEHHHPDYSQPFEFIYICPECHRKLHIELRAKDKRKCR